MREPHRLCQCLEQPASACHRFHDSCRILPRTARGPDAVTRARLWPADAGRVVLRNRLGLLGVSAPERMQPGAVRCGNDPAESLEASRWGARHTPRAPQDRCSAKGGKQ
ncbi:DALR anticodon-binding domain-containing protein [Streptomyces sp. NPDC001817]|uniref:DALR anticodon-binding domain-containing protein n=1 Tax=Streptomyces sp. NPDC001817 TaxID=3154398 RepID=UPI00331E6A2D